MVQEEPIKRYATSLHSIIESFPALQYVDTGQRIFRLLVDLKSSYLNLVDLYFTSSLYLFPLRPPGSWLQLRLWKITKIS